MSEDSSPQERGYPTADDVKRMQEQDLARRQEKKDKRGKDRWKRRADGGRVDWETKEKEEKAFKIKHALPGRKNLPPGTSTAAPKPKPPGRD